MEATVSTRRLRRTAARPAAVCLGPEQFRHAHERQGRINLAFLLHQLTRSPVLGEAALQQPASVSGIACISSTLNDTQQPSLVLGLSNADIGGKCGKRVILGAVIAALATPDPLTPR